MTNLSRTGNGKSKTTPLFTEQVINDDTPLMYNALGLLVSHTNPSPNFIFH